MSGATSKYSLELRNPDGLLLADFSGRAQNRRITQSRNEAEKIEWELDLNDLEDYARRLGVSPQTMLIPYQTEVRIKRDNEYLVGGQLDYAKGSLAGRVSLQASGFLNLFQDRFTGPNTEAESQFTSTDAIQIGWSLINTSQSRGDNYDFGVTEGVLEVGPNYSITYDRTRIKDALQDFGKNGTSGFDHQFTYDKQFNAYLRLGSDRPEVVFESPGNIIDADIPNDATGLINHLLMLGSGLGELGRVSATVESLPSQAQHKVREAIMMESNQQDADVLEDHGNAVLAVRGNPIRVPSIEVDGNIAPYVTDYGIGDRVKVIIRNHRYYEDINGMYKVEKRVIDIDKDDNEGVKLYVTA